MKYIATFKKAICIVAVISCSLQAGYAKNPEQVKNVIIMIPDGTSASVLTLSRLYKSGIGYAEHQQIDKTFLHIDPYICGMVKTYCSDAPIGGSAPTGSTYATGVISQAGYIATYPEKTKNDIVAVDPDLANTPAMTILEAAKLMGKSTGLVVTVEFPHATPADFSTHTSDRGDYKNIASQMVKNHIDVVFGGGSNYLNDENKAYLQNNGWEVILNDYSRVNSFSGDKIWGLFAPTDLPFDLDRTSDSPSLKEMTEKAIEILSKNENGFFLMAEGSKVDWAAHANDPIAMVTDFLAFDEAVKVAIDFAVKDGNTAVIICPDHGNSGLSIGGPQTNSGYTKIPKDNFVKPLINSKMTLEGFAHFLTNKDNTKNSLRRDFSDYLGITDLNKDELSAMMKVTKKNSKTDKIEQHKVKSAATKIFNSRTCVGFTTTGHTGEDVFLGVYHPKGDILTGVRNNVEVNEYMQQLFGIESLSDSTKKYFCGHNVLFPSDQYRCEVKKVNDVPTLRVTSNKTKKSVMLKAYDNVALVNKKTTIPFQTVFVYMDKRNEFFIPRQVKKLID